MKPPLNSILASRYNGDDRLDSKTLTSMNRSVLYELPSKVAKKAQPISGVTRYWGRVEKIHRSESVWEITLWNVENGDSYFLNYTMDAPGYSRQGRLPSVGDSVSVLIWYEGDVVASYERIHLEMIDEGRE